MNSEIKKIQSEKYLFGSIQKMHVFCHFSFLIHIETSNNFVLGPHVYIRMICTNTTFKYFITSYVNKKMKIELNRS